MYRKLSAHNGSLYNNRVTLVYRSSVSFTIIINRYHNVLCSRPIIAAYEHYVDKILHVKLSSCLCSLLVFVASAVIYWYCLFDLNFHFNFSLL